MAEAIHEAEILNEEKPGWFERCGIWYFHRLENKHKDNLSGPSIARTDNEMVFSVRRVTLTGSLIAFLIGGLSAGGSVWTEDIARGEGLTDLFVYAWVGGVTAILTLIEFAVLFWVSIRTVYAIAVITGHNRMMKETDRMALVIPNLLSRAALEIPDPVRHLFGIDPMARVSKKKMLVIGLLYKLKIMASNVLAKLVLKRVIGKGAFRFGSAAVNVAYISVPITGLWNALVTIKVAREARLRLFGNLLAAYMADEVITEEKLSVLSPAARIGCMQAVGNSVVLTQNYHPNMVILLLRLASVLKINEGHKLEDWDIFLKTLSSVSEKEKFFLLDLLAVSTAFDGKLSPLEKRMLPEAFQENTDVYMKRIKKLKQCMENGRLNDAKKLCMLDFEAG